MSTTKNGKGKEYVDPILIKEGFFTDEKDYVQTMDKMFEGLVEWKSNDGFYVLEKLDEAVSCLVGPGSQPKRLLHAVTYLTLLESELKSENIPTELADELRDFIKEMTSVPAKGNQGRIRATIDTLDEQAVDRAAKKIRCFHRAIENVLKRS